MTLVRTSQKTKGRKLVTNGRKKMVVHAALVPGGRVFCGHELSFPIESEGTDDDVTCPRCRRIMEEREWRKCQRTHATY